RRTCQVGCRVRRGPAQPGAGCRASYSRRSRYSVTSRLYRRRVDDAAIELDPVTAPHRAGSPAPLRSTDCAWGKRPKRRVAKGPPLTLVALFVNYVETVQLFRRRTQR